MRVRRMWIHDVIHEYGECYHREQEKRRDFKLEALGAAAQTRPSVWKTDAGLDVFSGCRLLLQTLAPY